MEKPSAQEILKKEQEAAANELLSTMVDLQDTLSLVVERHGGLDSNEKEAFKYANLSLISFSDSQPIFSTARPRSIREEDRKKILPGQHAGVFLQFDLDDGTILRVNFWGGLRMTSSHDLKDRDTSLVISHTRRTEEVLEQSTHLNWQINYPNGPTFDSWITYNPNNNGSFQQSALKIGGESIDCHPNILNSSPMFQKIKKSVFEPINKLIRLVPSSV